MGEILKLKKNPVGEIWCGRVTNLVRMRTTRATSARSLLMVGTSVRITNSRTALTALYSFKLFVFVIHLRIVCRVTCWQWKFLRVFVQSRRNSDNSCVQLSDNNTNDSSGDSDFSGSDNEPIAKTTKVTRSSTRSKKHAKKTQKKTQKNNGAKTKISKQKPKQTNSKNDAQKPKKTNATTDDKEDNETNATTVDEADETNAATVDEANETNATTVDEANETNATTDNKDNETNATTDNKDNETNATTDDKQSELKPWTGQNSPYGVTPAKVVHGRLIV